MFPEALLACCNYCSRRIGRLGVTAFGRAKKVALLQEAAAVCELLLALRFFPSMHQAGRILCCGTNKALKCPRTGMCDAEDQRALAVPAPRTEGLWLESRASGFFHGSPPFSPEGGLPVKTQWC